MGACYLAVRVLPDRLGRPRVAYLAGWTIGAGPTWARSGDRADVLKGSQDEAEAWRQELAREGITAHVISEG